MSLELRSLLLLGDDSSNHRHLFLLRILNSSTGRAFKAIREDVIAASVSGINVPFYKLLAFVISAIYGFGRALRSYATWILTTILL